MITRPDQTPLPITYQEHGLLLRRVPAGDPHLGTLWSRHYTGSRGAVGRQLHYLIYYDGQLIGAISGGSAVFKNAGRDGFFNVTEEYRLRGLPGIVNNIFFRLERPSDEPPLATEVLAAWREQVGEDWLKRYGDGVIGFETFVEPPRWEGVYKLDGWTRCGRTTGFGKRRPGANHGLDFATFKAHYGTRKIVWCKEAADA